MDGFPKGNPNLGLKGEIMESPRVKMLNVELGILKTQLDKLCGMLSQENFKYNVIESQFETLKARNAEKEAQIVEAEKKLRSSLEAADSIGKMAEDNARNVRANAQALYVKAQAKFKEIEEKLETAEKSQIKRHLKELEAVTA